MGARINNNKKNNKTPYGPVNRGVSLDYNHKRINLTSLHRINQSCRLAR